MEIEYDALINNNTWTLVHLSPNKIPIRCKWVFRVKENSYGTINKYKARLVAKGYHQSYGVNFYETFSSIIKPATIRVILKSHWQVHQLDVNNAILRWLSPKRSIHVTASRI